LWGDTVCKSEQSTLYPEDGGSRFPKTLGTPLPKYMVPHPTKPQLHNHYQEYLNSHITETSFIPFRNNSLRNSKGSNGLIQSKVTLNHPFIEIWTLPFILCHAFITSHSILKANNSALKVQALLDETICHTETISRFSKAL